MENNITTGYFCKKATVRLQINFVQLTILSEIINCNKVTLLKGSKYWRHKATVTLPFIILKTFMTPDSKYDYSTTHFAATMCLA